MTSLRVAPAPHGLSGRLRVPGDKSISHRALLLAARADGTSRITGLSDGADVLATLAAIQAFGARVERSGEGLAVQGGPGRLHEPESVIGVGNSGTAIRLLVGWAASIDGLTVLAGDMSIARRPMDRVAQPLRLMGASIDGRRGGTRPPLAVRGGPLTGIEYHLPVPSAQVKGAILLAGMAASSPTVVHEPVATRIHTEQMLAACGARVDLAPGRVTVHPGSLQAAEFKVPGDPSQAAFWVVAACVTPGSDLTVENVYVGPQRAGFVDVLRRMGADVRVEAHDPESSTADIRARYGPLQATDVGGVEVPGVIDEIPVLAVAAAYASGKTTFSGAEELKVKESDRIATTVTALNALGADAEGRSDGLVVNGGAGRPLQGGQVDSAGDHRVAMAAAVAALPAAGAVQIGGWEAVSTSYPRFEEDLQQCLGQHG
ncbi:MAG: 3-phosphoshikimate 1-carboxyvinyltransferase [Acidimicrobiales bacterium]|nr:3-phosphoshikimate 1-carboxyvinyltransferase [Acidimicrobiales bacterium]